MLQALARIVAAVNIMVDSPRRCDACTGSRVLPTGPCAGRVWCFVERRTVPPQSFCGSFVPAGSQEGMNLGERVDLGLQSGSPCNTRTLYHG